MLPAVLSANNYGHGLHDNADHEPSERRRGHVLRLFPRPSEEPEPLSIRPCHQTTTAANTSRPNRHTPGLRRSKAIKRRKTAVESRYGMAVEPSQEEIIDLYSHGDEPCDSSLQLLDNAANPKAPEFSGTLDEKVDLQIEIEHDTNHTSPRSSSRSPREAAPPKTLPENTPTALDPQQPNARLTFLQYMLTPRNIVFMKGMERGLEPTWVFQPSNTENGLNQKLTLDEASELAKAIDARPGVLLRGSVWLMACDICHVPRFRRLLGLPFPTQQSGSTALPKHTSQQQDATYGLHYSPLGSTPCCSRKICESCYTGAITKSIAVDFWHDIDARYWLSCPFRTCQLRLPLSPSIELTSILGRLPDSQAVHHIIAQFQRANRLRAALCALEPQPTSAALQRAAELHTHLQRQGRTMRLDDFHQTLNAKIEVLPVDSVDGSETLQVPIFVDLIASLWNSRDCIVCAETIPDVTDGSPEQESRWEVAISLFPGDWAHLIRPFMPPSSLPVCSAAHALDICRSCLAHHVEAQLETLGLAISGSLGLTCPSLGCSHLYTDSELRIITSPETFARYDKLRLLSYLSNLADFRWCLGEGCHSGQVYDFSVAATLPSFATDLPLGRRNRVVCDECGFAMCFAHQTPWHEGLDCIEYDAERGDPQLEATRAWIRDNTKACPGCEAPVEKGAGCFHMTCRRCGWEFCWECLANWKEIVSVNPTTRARKYRRDKHAVGCYFRSASAPEATMLAGHTVQQALGR